MAIDPDVINSSSEAGRFAKKVVPRWFIYISLIVLFFVLINLVKVLIPWVVLILIAAFILKKVNLR